MDAPFAERRIRKSSRIRCSTSISFPDGTTMGVASGYVSSSAMGRKPAMHQLPCPARRQRPAGLSRLSRAALPQACLFITVLGTMPPRHQKLLQQSSHATVEYVCAQPRPVPCTPPNLRMRRAGPCPLSIQWLTEHRQARQERQIAKTGLRPPTRSPTSPPILPAAIRLRGKALSAWLKELMKSLVRMDCHWCDDGQTPTIVVCVR